MSLKEFEKTLYFEIISNLLELARILQGTDTRHFNSPIVNTLLCGFSENKLHVPCPLTPTYFKVYSKYRTCSYVSRVLVTLRNLSIVRIPLSFFPQFTIQCRVTHCI